MPLFGSPGDTLYQGLWYVCRPICMAITTFWKLLELFCLVTARSAAPSTTYFVLHGFAGILALTHSYDGRNE